MPCISPDRTKPGQLCPLAQETFKRICRKCKHNVSIEEADAYWKTMKYKKRMAQS